MRIFYVWGECPNHLVILGMFLLCFFPTLEGVRFLLKTGVFFWDKEIILCSNQHVAYVENKGSIPDPLNTQKQSQER